MKIIWRYWMWLSNFLLFLISFMLWWLLHHPPFPWPPDGGCPNCNNFDIAAYLGMGAGVLGVVLTIVNRRSEA